ncbi:MAG: GNAT family N-acetyltransferase [Sciscionella sp.]
MNAPAALSRREWAADLSPHELYALLTLRVAVFVVEQHSAYPDLDGRDLSDGARHHWVSAGEEVLGCLRILDEDNGVQRIGRMCIAPSARGTGIGRRLMEAAMADLDGAACVLDAQREAVSFYQKFGFTVSGDTYDDFGVPHVPMRRG